MTTCRFRAYTKLNNVNLLPQPIITGIARVNMHIAYGFLTAMPNYGKHAPVKHLPSCQTPSMVASPQTTAQVSAIPNDLYREIVENLNRPQDRGTLLSLALVCKMWRTECQRVLFGSVCDEPKTESRREEDIPVIEKHIRFLETILQNPKFGPLVHTYAQSGLACDPRSMN